MVSYGTRTRDRLDHSRSSPAERENGPFRRLPGVYAGAQARVAARYHRLIDTKDFQQFCVLKPAGITAVHSPVHDS
jgi:hypothetical protein